MQQKREYHYRRMRMSVTGNPKRKNWDKLEKKIFVEIILRINESRLKLIGYPAKGSSLPTSWHSFMNTVAMTAKN